MKRFLALFLVFSLLCPVAMAEMSPTERYEAAALLMLQGDHAAAAEAFAALSGYSDAPQMSIYCRGLALAEEGDFARAEKAFTQLGSFKDAAVWAIACRGMAAQAEGERLVAAGTLQGFTDGPAMLETAAEYYDQIDYLPEMAARAESCRALASQATLDVAARSFDGVYAAGYGLCVVRRGQLYGVVNTRGELVVPCEWEDIFLSEHVVVVQKEDRWGALSRQGGVILACEYQVISPFGSVLVVRQHGKSGVMRLTGEVLVPCEWASCDPYGEEMLRLRRDNAAGGTEMQWVLSDAAVALPEGTVRWSQLSEDVLLLSGSGDFQLYSVSTGKMVDGGEEAMAFGDGFITVEDYETGAFTWYDVELNVLTPPEGAVPGLNAGLWVYLTEDGDWYLTDLQGRTVLAGDDVNEVDIDEFDGGYSAISMPVDGKETWMLLDSSGDILLTADEIDGVYDGRYAEISEDGVWQLADLTTGACAVLPEEISRLRHIEGSLFYVRLAEESGWRLLNAAQGWLGETVYSGTSGGVRNGLLQVSVDGLSGFVNLQGEEVVPCEYDRIEQYGSLLVARQWTDGGTAYSVINARGQVFPCESMPLVYGTMYRWQRGEWLYNASGEAIYEVDRADSWSAGGGYIFAVEDGLLTVYDETGSCIY
ncbi:MAG: WG repeat-containing protein [Clostridia bacterium]|nr:WG repeat-containing protein [Clostridia bacterium]